MYDLFSPHNSIQLKSHWVLIKISSFFQFSQVQGRDGRFFFLWEKCVIYQWISNFFFFLCFFWAHRHTQNNLKEKQNFSHLFFNRQQNPNASHPSSHFRYFPFISSSYKFQTNPKPPYITKKGIRTYLLSTFLTYDVRTYVLRTTMKFNLVTVKKFYFMSKMTHACGFSNKNMLVSHKICK